MLAVYNYSCFQNVGPNLYKPVNLQYGAGFTNGVLTSPGIGAYTVRTPLETPRCWVVNWGFMINHHVGDVDFKGVEIHNNIAGGPTETAMITYYFRNNDVVDLEVPIFLDVSPDLARISLAY